MTPEEAIRFLALLGVEYAGTLGAAGKPATQETLMLRIEAAAMTLRNQLPKDGSHAGNQG